MAANGGVPVVRVGEITRIISSANASLRGYEANNAMSTYLLDNAIQEQIDSLKREESSTRDPESVDPKYSTSRSKSSKPTKYDRLVTVQTDLQSVIDAIKNAGNDQEKLAKLGIEG